MCTGFFIKTKDGNYIFGRTMEFSIGISWFKYQFKDIIGTLGHIYNTDVVGMTDGLNKSGLLVATFYYPSNFEYSKKKIPGKKTIQNIDVNLYLLQQCKNVEDVIQLAPKLNVHSTIAVAGKPMSLHWIVCDKSGRCIVLEVKNKNLTVYENPLGIFTNSPSFPEHIAHLKKFRSLSNIGPDDPRQGSMGTGAVGLPGDGTSMSRFVRAHFYKKNLFPANTRKEGFQRVFALLHNFDIPVGSVLNPKTNVPEVTEYTVAYSLNDFKQIYAPYGYIYRNHTPIFVDKTPVADVPQAFLFAAIKAKKWNLLKSFIDKEKLDINKAGKIRKNMRRKVRRRTRRKRHKKKHTVKKLK